jgi:tRNA-uridine 2-sulfurtransferase
MVLSGYMSKGKDGTGKTVYCAMSGGVDSSTSAALLLTRGFAVVGVFIKVWQPPFMDCPWREDRTDAMRVCAHLNIPFYEVDLGEAYKKEVVDYMVEAYKKGDTPNPDVMCNEKIKFGAFFDWAIGEGADFVATGHYARIESVKVGEGVERGDDLGEWEFAESEALGEYAHGHVSKNDSKNVFKLLQAKDKNKDQTYFLWTLKQKHLAHILFPVGEYTKPEVRELAKKFGLPTAERRESQGLCFLGKLDMKEFLSHHIPQQIGVVVDELGETVGEHDGAWFYTIGQRHGFRTFKKSPSETPWYVVSKKVKENILVVSHSHHDEKDDPSCALDAKVHITKCNWITELPTEGIEYDARFRYRQALEKCTVVSCRAEEVDIIWKESCDATISTGQSLVLYSGEKVLGGGIIVNG